MSNSPSSPQPRIRVAAIAVRDGAILLVRHEKHGERYWLLPGGGVDFGETLPEALAREVREETGLAIEVGDLVFVHDSIPPDRHRHQVNLYFMASVGEGEPRIAQPDERLVEARFVPKDDLPRLALYPDVREPLAAVLSNGPPRPPTYLGSLWKP